MGLLGVDDESDLIESSKFLLPLRGAISSGWDLFVSGVVQVTPDKLRSSYLVMSK